MNIIQKSEASILTKTLQFQWQENSETNKICIRKHDQYNFTAEQKAVKIKVFKRLLSIQICAWFLLTNIKQFGRSKIISTYDSFVLRMTSNIFGKKRKYIYNFTLNLLVSTLKFDEVL